MGKNFMRQLSKSYVYYSRLASQEVDVSAKSLAERQKSLIRKVSHWVGQYSWLRNKETVNRVKCFISSGFKYNDALNKLNEGRKEPLSLNAYKVSINYASDKLKSLFGDDFFKVVDSDCTSAEYRFAIIEGGNSLDSVVLKEVSEAIGTFDFLRFSLEDCSAELYFLSLYSKAVMTHNIASLSIDKLRYLKNLIEGKDIKNIDKGVKLRAYLQRDSVSSLDDVTKFLQDIV